MEEKKKLVLLDAHAIIHRAYHALPDFHSSSGEPTGALFGVANMLVNILRELKPDYCVACFDLPAPTHRHKVYEEYKGTRRKSDPELVAQLKRSRDLFKVFGIPIYELAGYEADDLLGTIAKKTKDDFQNVDIVIASGDMDTLQLVDDKRVQVFTFKRTLRETVLYDESAVIKKFGFVPELLPDFKGLRGDPSDNIPGIAGIGEKTATTLVSNFGSIENIYDVLENDPDKILSTGLKPRILKLLKGGQEEAFFSKMLATIKTDAPIEFKMPKNEWVDSIHIDDTLKLFAELEFRTIGARIKNLLSELSKKNQNTESVGDKNEPNVDSIIFKETAVALWLLKSDITDPNLEDVLQFTGTNNFEKARAFILKLIKERRLEFVLEKIEKPLIPVIQKMNKTGILLDIDYLKKLSKKYHKELDILSKKIYELAGTEFNIRSPGQLAEVLFDKLGLKSGRKTAGGKRSTRESELEKLREEHKIIDFIFEYRELQKLLSTYIDNLPKMVDEKNRLHTEFVQTGTTTGRISSKNPNLQNIPVRTELGKNVRDAFIASDGFTLVSIDYSQIELRLAAIISGDKELQKIFKQGGDVHNSVAARVFDKKENEVTSEDRRKAKVINFGILYGMGVNALKQNLGWETTTKEAREYLNAYFDKFSGLASWIEKTKLEAARLGYTETLFGRRRYFEGIHSKLPFIRASAERMAINAPIQGTQSDIIKMAMVEIDKTIQKKYEKYARMLLQVHDELIFEISSSEVKSIAQEFKTIMENILPKEKSKGVPIIATVKMSKKWGEL